MLNKILSVCLLFLFAASFCHAGEHAFSVGFHYFYALDDIRNDLKNPFGDVFHRDSFAINAAYRYKPTPRIGFMFEVQTFPSGYLDAENAISPRVLILFGKSLYFGGGIAWNYVNWENLTESLHDNENWSDPYYLLRAGLERPFIVPDLKIFLDATYEASGWNDIEAFDSDSISFGIGARVTL